MNSIISKLNPVRLFCGCWPAILRTTGCPSGSFVSKNPIKRADPGIYSQRQVFLSGGIPTWDNPDIKWINTNSVNVRIRNFSNTFPVGGALVHCDLSKGGIGVPWNRAGSQQVNLDPLEERNLVFVVPDSDVFMYMHRGPVRITIEYHNDSRISNNYGEQRISHPTPNLRRSGPGEFYLCFPIVNNTPTEVTWRLKIVYSNAEATRVEPDIVNLGPRQLVTCNIFGLHPPPPNEGFWRATVIIEDTDMNLIGGISLVPYPED